MKILIAGLAKTGTTGLLYLIVNSLKDKPRIIFEPRTCPDDLDHGSDVIAKILIGSPGLDPAAFSHFDKKVTIVRDPRDRMISGFLYAQFHENYLDDDTSVTTVNEILKRKENNPTSVSIRQILSTIGSVTGAPKAADNKIHVIENSLARFDEYVAVNPDSLLYRYEDFVSGNFSPLEKYLGFQVAGKAEVPKHFRRVVRTKGYGDWRNWFTEEDVDKYRKMISPWLEKYGYDANDWQLSPTPVIDASHCSEYFMRLVREHRENTGRNDVVLTTAPQTAVVNGRIVRAEPRVIAGWAIGPEVEKPVRVALLLNGTQIAQVEANRLRPGLQKRGLHPTGECGFVFRFGPDESLPVGAKVVVQPVSGNGVIKNSPCIIRDPDQPS
jgi:hypothetical protein